MYFVPSPLIFFARGEFEIREYIPSPLSFTLQPAVENVIYGEMSRTPGHYLESGSIPRPPFLYIGHATLKNSGLLHRMWEYVGNLKKYVENMEKNSANFW